MCMYIYIYIYIHIIFLKSIHNVFLYTSFTRFMQRPHRSTQTIPG